MARALDRQRGPRRLTEHGVEQEVERGAARSSDVDAQHLAELSLWIEIDEKHALAALAREEVTNARGKRRLAASAFLVDEGDPACVQDDPPGNEAPWPSVRRSSTRLLFESGRAVNES